MFARPLLLLVSFIVLLSACQSSGPEPIADCLTAEDIARMRVEYNANPGATTRKYSGERVCVEAEFDGTSSSVSKVDISGYAEEELVFIYYFRGSEVPPEDEEERKLHEETTKKADALEKWAEDKEFGDKFQAICTIRGFDDTGEFRSVGTPNLQTCGLVDLGASK